MPILDRQPHLQGGFAVWQGQGRGMRFAFVGRGEPLDRDRILRRATGVDRPVAWARQVHGTQVLAGHPGCAGDGDALVTDREDLALVVATADCVPVVLAAPGRIAVVHAGWRGIVAGIVGRVLRREFVDAAQAQAWIGPAIGACCYEVGPEVAERVAAVGGPHAPVANTAELGEPARIDKPHLDLVAAVIHQLEAAGVGEIESIGACTRCRSDELWSYRREGPAAGRNYTFAWRTSAV